MVATVEVHYRPPLDEHLLSQLPATSLPVTLVTPGGGLVNAES